MPLREYGAFVKDWQDEDKTTAYRNADLLATIMNQNPYRKKAVTAAELLGEVAEPSSKGNGLGMIRLVLDSITANAKKTKGGDGNG